MKQRVRTLLNLFRGGAMYGLLLTAVLPLSLWSTAALAEPVCAQVKIEIKQELTLERQGFLANMRINNGLTGVSIENVNVTVDFTDDAGNPVVATSDPNNTTADFFIREDQLINIDNVTGTGSVLPQTTADISWLIIPTPGAGGTAPGGKLYFVGATLNYTVGGVAETVQVTPDFITVRPMPQLTLDYFLTREIFADDAFTPGIVEPPEPFTLGVRVKNNGSGPASGVKIESGQPKIVENEQGLLINFEIIDSSVNDQPIQPGLLIDFGTIDPATAGVGRWSMITTLSGEFVDFSASFIHDDGLGGQLTSLIEATNTYDLIHDVLVDEPGRDLVRDFLATDGITTRIHESSGLDTPVTDQSAGSSLVQSAVIGEEIHYTLATPVTIGPMWVKLADPNAGTREVRSVIRSDGKLLPPDNAWVSKTRDTAGTGWDYFVNVFDTNSTGSYSIVTGTVTQSALPPVFVPIPDRVGAEGQAIAFTVEATDPNGTIPILSATPLPAGSSFVDNGNGTGTFNWSPAVGQAGNYYITYTASDGSLSGTDTAMIKVNPAWDTDGDGMDDAWELANFGTLDRDGSGDYDGDGISDLQEYLDGTDPAQPLSGPPMPQIQSPGFGTEVPDLQPLLTVLNSAHDPAVVISYDFEVYSNAAMTDLVVGTVAVAEGVDTTAWMVDVPLADNSIYFWRVRADDGATYSPWAGGEFFINTSNDAPEAAVLVYPGVGATAGQAQPVLQFLAGADPDRDSVTHVVEVYTDSALTLPVTVSTPLAVAADEPVAWTVDTALTDGAQYYWRIVSTDEHGAAVNSSIGSFFVSTANTGPTAPQLVSPASGSEVATLSADLVVANAVDPEGDALSYYFEIDDSPAFDSVNLQTSPILPEQVANTSWTSGILLDNTQYYWRARASDGLTDSPWTYGRFQVNTSNEAPGAPVIANPGDQSWVDTLKPVLSVHPAVDPDGDALAYVFEIYQDSGLTTLVESLSSVETTVRPTLALTDLATYYWRVQARDEHNLTGPFSAVASFRVVDNGVNDAPVISPIGDRTFLEGDAVSIVVSVFDPEGDSLSFTATGLPASLAVDPATGTITGTLGNADAGAYNVTLTVSDGVNNASQSFVLTVTESNTAPVLTPIGDQVVDEGASLVINLSASDVPGDSLSFSATGLPAFAVFTDNLNGSATLILNPGFTDAGGYAVTLTVSDNGVPSLSVAETFTITVNDVNRAPVLSTIGNQSVDEGGVLNLLISASDPDGDSLTFTATGLPLFASLADHLNGTATLTVAPGFADAGSYPLTITVTDNGVPPLDASEAVGLQVNNVNRLPLVSSPGDQLSNEGETVSVAIVATDPDGTPLTFSALGLPPGLAIDLNTGVITGTFGFESAGAYPVTVDVTDGEGSSSTAFVWTVNNVNRAPLVAAIAAQTVNEGATLQLPVGATDADGDAISLSIVNLPLFGGFTDNLNGAGTLSFAPDYAQAGSYTITVVATDSGVPALSHSVDFVLTVVDVNRPPVLTAIGPQAVDEAASLNIALSAVDPDGDGLAFSATGLPVFAILTDNGNGTAGIAVNPDYTDAGSYTITVTATDGRTPALTASESFVLTVNNVNRAPELATPADQSSAEGDSISLAVQASDADGETLTWTAIGLPAGLAVNTGSGVISGTIGYDAAGAYSVTVSVSDGTASASGTFAWTVANTNRAPVLTPIGHQSVDENAVLNLTLNAGDADGDSLSFAATGLPAFASLSDHLDGTATLALAPGYTDAGSYSITVIVSDNGTPVQSTSEALTITVNNVNRAPEIVNPGPQVYSEGELVSLQISASDPDGDTLSYTATGLPLSLSMDLNTGLISGTLAFDEAGTYPVTASTSDGTDTTSTSFTLDVTEVNRAPVLNAIGPQSINEGVQLSIGLSASDPDGDGLGFTAYDLPAFAQLTDNGNGSASLVVEPGFEDAGSYSIMIEVTDDRNPGALSASETFVLTVNDVNRVPVAIATDIVYYPTTSIGSVDATESYDPDRDPLTFIWSFISVPPGSVVTDATIVGRDSPYATILLDEVGDYVLNVLISDGQSTNSITSTIVAVPDNQNLPPRPDAGEDLYVPTGVLTNVSGSSTMDLDDRFAKLNFNWTFASVPTGSQLTDAQISGAGTVDAAFTPDAEGNYVLTLTVDDGSDFAEDQVVITAYATDIPPNALVEPDKLVSTGSTVTVDASASFDPDSLPAPLSYSWSLVYVPNSSTLTGADIVNANGAIATFVPDRAGRYVLRLDVNDGAYVDFVQITVRACSFPLNSPACTETQ